MLSSDRYEQDSILVERASRTRDGDGVTEGAVETVLDCDGDAQSLEIAPQELQGSFKDGGLRFFATGSILEVRPGDSATVTLNSGETIEATVESVELTGDALVLSVDRVQ